MGVAFVENNMQNLDTSTRTLFGPKNYADALKLNPLSPHVSQHLKKVYLVLAATLLTAAIGCFVHIATGFGFGASLASIALIFAIAFTKNPSTRFAMLLGFGFTTGLSVGPLVSYSLDTDPQIVLTALLGTTVVFGTFSMAALLSDKRHIFFLAGVLGTSLNLLMFLTLINFFIALPFFYTMNIYFGLVLFSLYVVFDTQLIVAKAELGAADAIWDALNLFIDFVGLFVRLLIILNKNKKKKSSKQRR